MTDESKALINIYFGKTQVRILAPSQSYYHMLTLLLRKVIITHWYQDYNILLPSFYSNYRLQCEKNSYGKPERMPQNVAVLGAGLMGAGVATVS